MVREIKRKRELSYLREFIKVTTMTKIDSLGVIYYSINGSMTSDVIIYKKRKTVFIYRCVWNLFDLKDGYYKELINELFDTKNYEVIYYD